MTDTSDGEIHPKDIGRCNVTLIRMLQILIDKKKITIQKIRNI